MMVKGRAGTVSGVGEILARLARSPAATGQVLAASALISVLGLAVSLYTIQILNRFVSNGVTGTLLTLTAGVGLAVVAEHQLRKLRWSIAETIAGDQERRLAVGTYGLLLTARQNDRLGWPAAVQEDLLRGIERAAGALGPAGITALADLPFAVAVLAVLTLLSPVLGAVTALFCAALALQAWRDQRRLALPTAQFAQASAQAGALVGAAVGTGETIRHFRGQARMMALWQAANRQAQGLGRLIGWIQLGGGSLTQVVQSLLGVAVVAAGALEVVAGQLDVATLVGANMIAGRVLMPFGRIVQLGASLHKAGTALTQARRFAEVAVEREGGRTLPDWRGQISLRGVAFGYPGQEEPAFGPLDLDIEPGGVVVVTGRNGTGKSTLVKVVAGLLDPVRGRILADGVDVRQLSLDWWRGRVSYLPQEPEFLPGTLRDNLRLARPDASDADLLRCLAEADLARFVDSHPQGLDAVLENGGRTLSPGIRRRLALARALLADGALYLLDEPSEGLDREAAQIVYAQLIALARRGRTLLIVSHDPVILSSARTVVRLDQPASTNQPASPQPLAEAVP
ncbi:ATP-binding cassette domain-containing protein [Azospirillum sp. sgz302134]